MNHAVENAPTELPSTNTITWEECRKEWQSKVRWTQAKIEELNDHIENNRGFPVEETLRRYRQELRNSISPEAQRDFVKVAKLLCKEA